MAATTEQAFRNCEKLATSHYENFTVGSFLLPRGTRTHIRALYAFARTTDDIGDESEGDRLANLDAWEEDFRRIRGGEPRHPVLKAVAATVRRYGIPDEPFLKLIEANRMDQRTTRWETWDDLLRYCDHSANPCGRLVLHVFGVTDADARKLSDCTCTALQLANFWQDVAIDWAKGRVYLPQEDLRRFRVTEEEIARGEVTDRWRALMDFEVERARGLFVRGLKLADRLTGAARFDVRLFSRGGMRILDLVEKADYDVFRRRPTISKAGKAWIAVRTLLGIGA